MSSVIETTNLSIGYVRRGKENNVVHNSLNLSLQAGSLTSLLGLNGAGKSTLLRTICGFQPALGGEIRVLGRLLSDYSQSELSRVIGVVLTEKTNAGGITVEELVSLGRQPYTGFFGRLRDSDKRIVAESLQSVDMTHKSGNYVSELSDGERQKIMIAKVLAQQCPIIILDEPTAFLDVTSRIEIVSLLHSIARNENKSILLSTHDLDIAIRMSDCLWLQDKGYPMACGTPEDLILNGVLEHYFEKNDIKFDKSTGRLKTDKQLKPIGIDGDSDICRWVGNALIRNGFEPSLPEMSDIKIHCESPKSIKLSRNAETKSFAGVSELVEFFKYSLR